MKPFRFMVGSRDVVDGRTLAERARWAESIGCSHIAVPDHLDVRVGWIREEAGDRFDQIDVSVLRLIGDLTITPEPLKVATDLANRSTGWTGVPITARDVLESPYTLIGTVGELVDKLKRIRERWGINSFLIGWFEEAGLRDFAPVIEQLAQA